MQLAHVRVFVAGKELLQRTDHFPVMVFERQVFPIGNLVRVRFVTFLEHGG